MKNLLSIIGFFVGTFIVNMIVNDMMVSFGAAGTSYALLTAGFTKVCAARSGGVKNIWLANRADLTTAGFTLTSGVYTAVTMATTKVFYKFEFDEDTAEARFNTAVENQSVSVTNEIEFYLGKLSATMRDGLQAILDTSPCGMIAIVEDNNGVKWVYGYTENHPSNTSVQGRPLMAQGIEATTGKVFTDATGANVILACVNNQAPLTFSGTVPVS